MVASQLESATRRVLADVVVSEDTIRASGRSYAGTTSLKIAIKGREKPLTAYGFASAPEIARRKREDVAVPVPVVAGGETTTPTEAVQEEQGEAGEKPDPCAIASDRKVESTFRMNPMQQQ